MTPRAVIGAGDLPLLVRAERVELRPTRQTVELLASLVVAELALREDGADYDQAHPAVIAYRIALIDALAELRGER